MDVLERLRHLIDERGWSVYRVAHAAGLSEKTVYNIYSRNTMPSIPTLQAICNAFGITLAQFFAEGRMIEAPLNWKLFLKTGLFFRPSKKKPHLR